MTIPHSDLNELLEAIRAGGDIDVVRQGVAFMLQALIDAEATAQIGAERMERTSSRTTQRNGSRDRLLSTKAGDVDLRIPKLRQGTFFPCILERRRRIDRALFAVVGGSDDGAFWTEFLRSLRARGLSGVPPGDL